MLLLITIGLVLVAAVTLLIGIFSNSLPLIYVSIGSSFLAAIVLVVLSQISRRGREVAPAPAAAPEPVTPQPVPERERVPAGVAAGATTTAPRPTATAAAFPLEGYDDLTVAEILPRLDDLSAEELDAVAEREETGKNRSSVLNRIDERLDKLEEDSIEVEEEVEDEDLQPATAGRGADDFPIDGYDELSIAEILPFLDDLDAEELDIVAEREETGKNRMSVLNRIDERLDELEGVAAPAPKKAAKKKAAAKKAPAKAKKRAATKRSPAQKKAAATKKAATKRAPAKKKAVAKKAPAKKKAAATKKKAAKKRP